MMIYLFLNIEKVIDICIAFTLITSSSSVSMTLCSCIKFCICLISTLFKQLVIEDGSTALQKTKTILCILLPRFM